MHCWISWLLLLALSALKSDASAAGRNKQLLNGIALRVAAYEVRKLQILIGSLKSEIMKVYGNNLFFIDSGHQ